TDTARAPAPSPQNPGATDVRQSAYQLSVKKHVPGTSPIVTWPPIEGPPPPIRTDPATLIILDQIREALPDLAQALEDDGDGSDLGDEDREQAARICDILAEAFAGIASALRKAAQ